MIDPLNYEEGRQTLAHADAFGAQIEGGNYMPFTPGLDPVPASGKFIGQAEIANQVKAVLEVHLTEGHWTKEFEQALQRWFDIRCASLCNSGSSANLLALTALLFSNHRGSRLPVSAPVITTAAGFPTTIWPAVWNRLTPWFIDVQMGTYVPSVEQIIEAIDASAGHYGQVVMLAHTLGNPWPVDEVARQRPGVLIVEDNCDAFGSEIAGHLTGTLGDVATLSFYPAHHITTGEGGAVLTRYPRLRKTIESLRDWGRDCWCEPGKENTCGKRFAWEWEDLPDGYDHKYVYSLPGFNLKSTDLQAAVGVGQMQKIDWFVTQRRWNFAHLASEFLLRGWNHYFILPEASPHSNPSWFGFPLTVREDAPFTREDLCRFLTEKKVGTRNLFAGNVLRQPALKRLPKGWLPAGAYDDLELPVTDQIMRSTFWVGVWPGLRQVHLDYMLECFGDFIKTALGQERRPERA